MKRHLLFLAIATFSFFLQKGNAQTQTISGKVYADINKNCIFDSTDVLLDQVPVKVYAGGFSQVINTQTDGSYSVNVPAGVAYSLTVLTPFYQAYLPNKNFICPANGVNTVSSLPATNVDFALKKGVILQLSDSNLTHFKACNFHAQPYKPFLYIYTIGYANYEQFKLQLNYGDGTVDTVTSNIGANYTLNGISETKHNYSSFGTFNVSFKLYTADCADSIILNNGVMYKDTCGSLTGRVYADLNNNCIYDAGDMPVPHKTIIFSDTSASAYVNFEPFWFTDSTGHFEIPTRDKTSYYQLSINENYGYGFGDNHQMKYRMTCDPLDGDTLVQTQAAIDFPMARGIYITGVGDYASGNYGCQIPITKTASNIARPVGYGPGSTYSLKYFFGDGKDTSFVGTITSGEYFDGNIWNVLNHTYTASGHYGLKSILTDSLGNVDTLISITTFILSDSCGNISGRVYSDNNGSCQYDSGEPLLTNKRISLIESSVIIEERLTDSLGRYSFNVPAGLNYTVRFTRNPSEQSIMICPSSGEYQVSTFPATNDFGISCSNGYDLTGNLVGWGFKPGYNGYLNLSVRNRRCENVNATVKLVKSPLINILSSSPAPDFTYGDTLVWYVNGMGITDKFFADLEVQTSTAAVFADSIRCQVILDPIAGDSLAQDNIVNYVFPVKNAWDPNMKELSVDGRITQSVIKPGAKDFKYTVYFQNTGNDKAYNIYVMDTLDTNIDPASLEIIESSHAMKVSIISGNILKFSFDNIMLLDSNVNQAASHGFVTYSIKLKKGLALGTTIKNTAYIYFDFNPAVVTNTTSHTLVADVKAGIAALKPNSTKAFPNPANKEFTVKFPDIDNSRWARLSDLTGRIVDTYQIKENSFKINSALLSNGLYILTVTDKAGLSEIKIAIVH